MNKLHRIFTGMCIILLVFLLSGCAERPFLAKGGIYSIVSIPAEGTTQSIPIQLTWNSNFAVMQQLLLEASFVLGDLHSQSPWEAKENTEAEDNSNRKESNLEPKDELGDTTVILLEATFPEAKPFELLIDDELVTLEISSVQIEVIGNKPGRVILNQDMVLQGIPNPNLESTFNEFLKMLQKTEQVPVRYGGNLA